MNAAYYQNCLKAELSRRVQVNRHYSLRAFARSLGFNSGALSQILSGKRSLSYQSAIKLLDSLNLSELQRRYFLVSIGEDQKRRGIKKMNPHLRKILKEAKIDPSDPPIELSHEIFSVISEWYHFALLELSLLPGFKADESKIARQLGITNLEAKLAIERLKDLRLLEDKNGSLKKSSKTSITADRYKTSEPLKKRQRQVLMKSVDSLENDPIEKRNHTAMTLAIDPAKLPEAKKRIQVFMQEMTEFLEEGQPQVVYEMIVNLFPLQKEID